MCPCKCVESLVNALSYRSKILAVRLSLSSSIESTCDFVLLFDMRLAKFDRALALEGSSNKHDVYDSSALRCSSFVSSSRGSDREMLVARTTAVSRMTASPDSTAFARS